MCNGVGSALLQILYVHCSTRKWWNKPCLLVLCNRLLFYLHGVSQCDTCVTHCVSVSVCTIIWCVHITRVVYMYVKVFVFCCSVMLKNDGNSFLYQIHVTLKILWMHVGSFLTAFTAYENCFLRKIIQIAPGESHTRMDIPNCVFLIYNALALLNLVIICWQQYVLFNTCTKIILYTINSKMHVVYIFIWLFYPT